METIVQHVTDHLRTFGNEHGYRTIWHSLRMRGIHTSRDMVMSVLRELDPEGAVLRKKKKLVRRSYFSNGPNDLWHIDGYDKLKPYGFPIHGCIDGYSRKMIWLTFVKSNNDPYTVGKLYFDAVEEMGRAPNRVRTDCGTENVFISASQCFLRRDHNDDHAGEKAHIYGSSHHNQRIEAWWSQFRKMKTQYMMTFFRKMVTSGEYNADDEIQKACIQFCFGDLIQSELDNCKEFWNSHYIRKSQRSQTHGRPNVLYHTPSFNFPDQSFPVIERDLDIMRDHLDEYDVDDSSIITEYFHYLSEEIRLVKPVDFNSARQNYFTLLSYV